MEIENCQTKNTFMNFRNDIQGLRAIAVLLVFIFHLNSAYLPGGFVGVDIFFVISGFLISSIILDKKEKQSFNIIDFYIGRIKRIVPAYLFFLIAIFILAGLVYLPLDITGLRVNIFHATIFNSNNYLAAQDNYFGAKASENPMLHTWTLAIEMQFYFILPALLLILKRKYIVPILLFSIVLLLAYSYYNSTFLNSKNAMYFSLLARMPEFLIGTLIAIKGNWLYVKENLLRNILSFISLIIIVVMSFAVNEMSNFPGLIVIVPCLAISFILINNDTYLNRTILSNKALVHLGELSYSIYLWHWGLMALLRYYNVRYQFTIIEIILLTIAVYALSSFSYKYIENYYRKLNTKIFVKKMVICFIVLGISAFAIPKINDKIFNMPAKFIMPTFGMNSHSSSFKDFELYGDVKKSNDSILLIGDSHALIYIPILDQIGKNNNFNFSAITNNTYPTIPGILRNDFPSDKIFNLHQSLTKHSSEAIMHSKLIIISSVWNEKVKSLPNAFETFVKKLRKDQKVLILPAYPTLDKDPIRLNRSIVKNSDTNYNYEVKIKPIPKNITNIIDKYPNIYQCDDIDYSTYRADIPYYRDTVMYYDRGHLNMYGTVFFQKKIEKDLMKKLDSILKK